MKHILRFFPNGENRTPDVVKALLYAPEHTVVEFTEGIYDFYAEGAYKGYFFPSSNRNGEKKVIFPLLNRNDITIEGNGAKFLFHDRVFPFVMQNCHGVVLRGFSVDFSFPRCLEAVVTRMEEDGFALSFSNGEYEVNEYGNLLIRAGKELFSSSERRFFLEQRDWHCFISVGDIYYDNGNAPADVIYCSAEEQGEELFLRYKPDSVKARFIQHKRLMVSYDELRENDVFFMEFCRDVEMQKVHILHGAGMGIVGQCTENLHLDEYVVDPCDGGLSSTTADAILLTNFTGKVRIENSRVDRSVDDAINIHGFYTRIERITDRNKAVARLVHPSQAGLNLYGKGDVLKVSHGDNMQEYANVTIKDSCIRDQVAEILLEFEEDVAGWLKVGDFLENNGRTPEVEIRNCFFSDFPAIRLSSGKKMVFENNIVKNCNGLLVNDLMRYWYLTGCVNGLEIKDNRFENMEKAISIFVDREGDFNVRHKNITILRNRFVNCRTGIEARHVDGLTIRDNLFEGVATPILLRECERVDCQEIPQS